MNVPSPLSQATRFASFVAEADELPIVTPMALIPATKYIIMGGWKKNTVSKISGDCGVGDISTVWCPGRSNAKPAFGAPSLGLGPEIRKAGAGAVVKCRMSVSVSIITTVALPGALTIRLDGGANRWHLHFGAVAPHNEMLRWRRKL